MLITFQKSKARETHTIQELLQSNVAGRTKEFSQALMPNLMDKMGLLTMFQDCNCKIENDIGCPRTKQIPFCRC